MKFIHDKKLRNEILWIVFIVLVFFALLRLRSGIAPRYKEYKEVRDLLGTFITVRCYYDPKTNITPIIEQAWQKIEDIQTTMSAKSAVGYVAQINKSGFSGVKVNDEVFRIIQDALMYSRKTDGAFDITVLPFIDLWHKAQEENRLPDKQTLANAKDKVGYTLVKLKSGNIVYLLKKGVKIDLGGIAKGYAVDQAAQILRHHHINDFLIDAGGDIYCHGNPPTKSTWDIGVQDPENKNHLLDILQLKDKAVTTSGDYERFFTISGKRYSHIIDPRTGYPEGVVISATVIAPTAEEADAYSTALCVLGPEKGFDIINSLNDVDAMIIEEGKKGMQFYYSPGYKRYKQ